MSDAGAPLLRPLNSTPDISASLCSPVLLERGCIARGDSDYIFYTKFLRFEELKKRVNSPPGWLPVLRPRCCSISESIGPAFATTREKKLVEFEHSHLKQEGTPQGAS